MNACTHQSAQIPEYDDGKKNTHEKLEKKFKQTEKNTAGCQKVILTHTVFTVD